MVSDKKNIVSIEKCSSYDPKKVRMSLLKSLKNIDFKFKRGMSVLIKPNLLGAHKPDEAVTTHPIMIEELCKILKEAEVGQIYIGDSSGHDTDNSLEVCGMNKLSNYAKIINFESEPKKFFNFGKKMTRVPLPKIVFDVDLVVDFAKLKTHALTGVTLCRKNLYGCIPGKTKENFHRIFPYVKDFSVLLDRIEREINPGLCLIDGVYGLEGEGPGASGKPIKSGVLIAGKSAGAVDIISSEFMGFNSMNIYTNKYSKIERNNIFIVGSGKDVRLSFKKPSTSVVALFFWLNRLLPKSKIITDEDKCRKCGICVKKCPVKALSLDPYAKCGHKLCIKCLCCTEVCPYDAIHLHDSALKKFLKRIVSFFRKI